MIKKFECKNCNKIFDADERGSVVCPYCHSDNVEPAGHHISALVWKAAASIIAILLVCGAIFLSVSRCGSSPVSGGPLPPEDSISSDPTVSVGQPELNDNGMYSVEVEGKNLHRGMKFYYVMMSHFDKQVLQKSKDGRFRDIPYCADDGHSYDFAIMDSNADTLLCFPVEQTGFIRQAVIKKEQRMTMEQLQNLINTQDKSLNGVGESDYMAPDYKLTFSGLPSDTKKPASWSEVFELLEYEIWESVTVEELGYDDKNRINSVTLKVNMPE